MPTTRAHYRHGESVLERVKPEARNVIEAYPELYHFGVHGPDLLFYYDSLKHNPVNQEGNRLHELPGSYFFDHAIKVLEQLKEEGSGDYRPALSYVYGYLCHFSLDVTCHGYVQEKIDASGISHTEIEAELDREILVREGVDPVRTKVTGHLAPSGKNARVVARFYENVSKEEIFEAMKSMVKVLDFLVVPSRIRRTLMLLGLKAIGQYEGKHGLIINYEKNPECADSTERLLELMDEAVDLAVRLIDEFPVIKDDAFRFNFESVDLETQEIYPVKTAASKQE